MTRQRKWQIKQASKGLCVFCDSPAVLNLRCLKHSIYEREAQRLRQGHMRRNNSVTYRLEKQAL